MHFYTLLLLICFFDKFTTWSRWNSHPWISSFGGIRCSNVPQSQTLLFGKLKVIMCISSRVHCYVDGLDMTEDWISQHHKVCSRVWFQMVFVTANICENGLAHFYGHVFLLLPLIQLAVCKLTFALLTIILIYINMFSTCHRQWPTGCLSRYCALPVDIFIWNFLKFF